MPVIRITALRPKGCDLIAGTFVQNGDGSVALSGQNRASVGKTGFDFLRTGACADVPVLRRIAEQTVTDAAADGIGRKAGFVQTFQQRLNGRRNNDLIL